MLSTIIYFTVFSVLGYALVYLITRSLYRMHSVPPLHMYALEIKRIPNKIPPYQMDYILKRMLVDYREDVYHVYSVPDYTASYQALLKVRMARKMLRYYQDEINRGNTCLLYTSPSPRDS